MEVEQPQRAGALVADAFRVYRRYPLLFLTLAAAVIVPWELLALAAGELASNFDGWALVAVEGPIALGYMFLVGSLVSALHVHAVAAIREGREPVLSEVAARGLRALPLVLFVTVISSIGVFLGFLALFVPGILLSIIWAVAAQDAAIEGQKWIAPLRRSVQLTSGQFGHVFVFLLLVALITMLPGVAAALALGSGVVPFLVELVVNILTWSFAALATALLYYDLRTRFGAKAASVAMPDRLPPRQTSWDPRVYTDENRPAGWYIVPEIPHRMKYWGGSDDPRWTGATRAPRKIREAWRAELPEH